MLLSSLLSLSSSSLSLLMVVLVVIVVVALALASSPSPSPSPFSFSLRFRCSVHSSSCYLLPWALTGSTALPIMHLLLSHAGWWVFVGSWWSFQLVEKGI